MKIKETLYKTLIANGVSVEDIDHHASDLYVRVTYKTQSIMQEYNKSRGINCMPPTFRSELEGDGWWYDIAFAYDPFWEAGE